MKGMFSIWLLVFGFSAGWTAVYGGDSLVIPVKGQFTSWDKKIPGSTRFKLVLDGEAVLDRMTGLVWDKSPDTTTRDWFSARAHCYQREVGDRLGWRLPTIEELASLVDMEGDETGKKLPKGHPFVGVASVRYWSSTTCVAILTTHARDVNFSDGLVVRDHKGWKCNVWCVRGGYGHDAY